MSEGGYRREGSHAPIPAYDDMEGTFQRRELQPLNQRQVAQAMRLVNQRHPLRHTPLWQALPYLRVIEGCLPQSCVDWMNGTNQTPGADGE